MEEDVDQLGEWGIGMKFAAWKREEGGKGREGFADSIEGAGGRGGTTTLSLSLKQIGKGSIFSSLSLYYYLSLSVSLFRGHS